jgi:hypothetical protein
MRSIALALAAASLLASGVASGEEIDSAWTLHQVSFTVGGQATPKLSVPSQERTASTKGKVCRNGNYHCTGIGSGTIGYSCCGCGFCGWWSAE